jgi:hypothetical protein
MVRKTMRLVMEVARPERIDPPRKMPRPARYATRRP